MNRNFKSLFNSVIVILLYYIAFNDIIKSSWNTTNQYQFEGRVKYLGLLIILFKIIGVILPYPLFNSQVLEVIYLVIIVGHISFLLVGSNIYLLKKNTNYEKNEAVQTYWSSSN